jgi:hypothetical protein
MTVIVNRSGRRIFAVAASLASILCVASTHAAAPEPFIATRFSYADGDNVPQKVKDECRFDQVLNESVDKFSAKRRTVVFAQSSEEFASSKRQLDFSIADWNSHEWRGGMARPGSLLTFDIKLLIDGQVVKETKKPIRTGRGFGACSRVEKIAEAAAKFVVVWTGRQRL